MLACCRPCRPTRRVCSSAYVPSISLSFFFLSCVDYFFSLDVDFVTACFPPLTSSGFSHLSPFIDFVFCRSLSPASVSCVSCRKENNVVFSVVTKNVFVFIIGAGGGVGVICDIQLQLASMNLSWSCCSFASTAATRSLETFREASASPLALRAPSKLSIRGFTCALFGTFPGW